MTKLSGQESSLFDSHHRLHLAAFIGVFGVLLGLLAGFLSWLLGITQKLLLGKTETLLNPSPAGMPAWKIVTAPLIAAILGAIVWYIIRVRNKTKIPSGAKAVAGERMPNSTIAHSLVQIVLVGAGVSVGRETAPRELGSWMAQHWGKWFKLSAHDTSIIVAVAAGAAFAGVYDAPLAGMFFAVEMLLANVNITVVGTALGTSVIAAFVGGLIKGTEPYYAVSGLSLSTPLAVMCIVFGAIAGCAGWLFRWLTSWAQKNQEQNRSILWTLPAAGLATGLLGIWLPQIMGNGRAAAQYIYSLKPRYITEHTAQSTSNLVYTFIFIPLVMCVIKTLLTTMTIRAGASGGVLAPAIGAGASLGVAVGFVWVSFVPFSSGISLVACAFVMTTAFLATTQKAPLMALCLMLEITHTSASFVVPVGLAVGISVLVSSSIDQIIQNKTISHK